MDRWEDEALVLGDRVKIYTWTEFNIEPEGIVEVGDDCVLVGAIFMCAESIRIGRRARERLVEIEPAAAHGLAGERDERIGVGQHAAADRLGEAGARQRPDAPQPQPLHVRLPQHEQPEHDDENVRQHEPRLHEECVVEQNERRAQRRHAAIRAELTQ